MVIPRRLFIRNGLLTDLEATAGPVSFAPLADRRRIDSGEGICRVTVAKLLVSRVAKSIKIAFDFKLRCKCLLWHKRSRGEMKKKLSKDTIDIFQKYVIDENPR